MVPFFSLLWAGLVLLIAFALAASPLLRAAAAPPQEGRRDNAIDGLRGFLAVAVVLHHAAMYRDFVLADAWRAPPSSFYFALGHIGVGFFFLITAYLFWGQVLEAKLSWTRFYIGRVFRIGPLYWAAFAVVLTITLVAAGGIAVPMLSFVKQVIRWSAMGALGQPDINGYPRTGLLLAGVTWSLLCEWIFYLALPLLAFFRRKPIAMSLTGAALCLIALAVSRPSWPSGPACLALFFLGIACASAPEVKLARPVSSLLVVTFGGLALISGHEGGPSVVSVICTGAAFYLITRGADVFGLLTSSPAVRLGNISYGVYLLQGLALFTAAPFLRPESPTLYWAVISAAVAALILIAAVAHVLVERPGIAFGKRLAGRHVREGSERVRA